MPPLCSMVFMPRGVSRRRTVWPSASDRTEPTCRLDRNRRRVLLLAWLTLLPYCTALPDRAQRRGMAISAKKRSRREAGRPAFYGPSRGQSSEPVDHPFADILDLILRNHPPAGRDSRLMHGFRVARHQGVPPVEVLAEMDQPVGAGLGEPVHLLHNLWGELDAVRDDLLAVLVVPAARGLGVQELAASVGLGQFAGALVFQLVDAAHAATVAQRFPLLPGHLGQRLPLPERQQLLGGGSAAGAPDEGLSGHGRLLAYAGPPRRALFARLRPRAPGRAPACGPPDACAARRAGFHRPRSTSRRGPVRPADGECPSRRPPA